MNWGKVVHSIAEEGYSRPTGQHGYGSSTVLRLNGGTASENQLLNAESEERVVQDCTSLRRPT